MQGPTGVRRRMTDLNKRTDLLEREADLEHIGGALRSAAAGSGGIVVIEGEPGIGKTSLLEEAAELAEAGRMSILRGYAHNQATAYDVAGWWRAHLAHEGMGLGAVPMAGHTGAMAAMIRGGHNDPRRAIEPPFARDRAKLIGSVDRRLTAVEKALDEASTTPSREFGAGR
jgi:AAA ATPase domain